MPFPHFPRNVVVLFAVSSLLASFARGDTAELILSSQPGDFIGQGGSYDITYPGAEISAQIRRTLPSGQPAELLFVLGHVAPSPNTFALLFFGTDQLGIPFQPGVYGIPGNTAQRADFAQPGHPGLDVSFQNRGSNTLTGNFTVDWVQFFKDASNNFQIGALDVTFEQHSEGATPALFGHFTYLRTGFAIPEGGSSVLLLLLGSVGLCCMHYLMPARLAKIEGRIKARKSP